MNRAHSVVAGGGRVVGGASVGMTRKNAEYVPMNNPASTPSGAPSVDAPKLLDRWIITIGKRLLLELKPTTQRSESDRWFLNDCAKGRRVASPETLAKLLVLQARAESKHIASDTLRELELELSPAPASCVFEASEQEQEVDAALDMAQLKLRDGSPARLQQILEIAPKAILRLRRLADAAAIALHRHARAGAR